MADAWTTLLVHSTLSFGDAWEHLNAQEGGSSSCGYISSNSLVFDMKIRAMLFDTKPVEILFDALDICD